MSEEQALEGRILAEVRGSVLVLTLANPARRNAFTQDMRRTLAKMIQDAAMDDALRAIVIRGEGGHFCAGADLGGVKGGEADAPLQFRERIRETHQVTRAIVASVSVACGLPGSRARTASSTRREPSKSCWYCASVAARIAIGAGAIASSRHGAIVASA